MSQCVLIADRRSFPTGVGTLAGCVGADDVAGQWFWGAGALVVGYGMWGMCALSVQGHHVTGPNRYRRTSIRQCMADRARGDPHASAISLWSRLSSPPRRASARIPSQSREISGRAASPRASVVAVPLQRLEGHGHMDVGLGKGTGEHACGCLESP